MRQRTIFISRNLSDESSFHHLTKNEVQIKAYSLLEFKAVSFSYFPNTDFIFFYSRNAVRFFLSQLGDEKITAKLGCMGSGTAKALESFGYTPEFVGAGNIEEIANAFLQICNHKSVLFPRAKKSRKSIQLQIQAQVEIVDLIVYDNIKKELFINPEADILLFTSPMNVEAYFELYPYKGEVLIAIGETTQEKMKELGLKNIITSKENSEEALLEEVKKALVQL